MSERERWIVYPLIFFALGAAIRDKLIQRVETKEMICESLQIVDLENPTYPLVELTFARHSGNDPNQQAEQVGSLRIVDSDGNLVGSIERNGYIERLLTRQVQVVDPHDHPLVNVGTEPVLVPGTINEAGNEGTITHQGVIYLNNEMVGTSKIEVTPPPSKKPKPNETP